MSKVGLLIICTNKYTRFLDSLLRSADQHFLKNQDVTYFIFTDQEVEIATNRKVVGTYVEHREWPWMTLGRYKIFSEASEELSKMDYLYYCDADMLFVGDIGDEILSDRVATQHPALFGTRGTPDTNPESLACVYPHEEMQYFAGGFNGGKSEEYLKMANTISNNIDIDYAKGIIALWHDESHFNRYCIDNQPTKILNPSYCYSEYHNPPFERKLVALNKNHQELRS